MERAYAWDNVIKIRVIRGLDNQKRLQILKTGIKVTLYLSSNNLGLCMVVLHSCKICSKIQVLICLLPVHRQMQSCVHPDQGTHDCMVKSLGFLVYKPLLVTVWSITASNSSNNYIHNCIHATKKNYKLDLNAYLIQYTTWGYHAKNLLMCSRFQLVL